MNGISYHIISQDESRIYEYGKNIGDVTRREDDQNPGTFRHYIQLAQDPRGVHRVPAERTIEQTVQIALETHPYFS